ncbi:MAG: FAD-dependent oxidoreductase [Myxococcales bacterium]|nr:FAD-dependent oxidoreductase [Myxococcales bacterium]
MRVAVVGAGPAGFFTADALLRRDAPVFDVDVFERLPTPFGLVRAGVAPDHQKIKNVTKTFDRTAKESRFRFMGNVRVGRDISAEELAEHYDQVVYAVGSSSDRRLGIPGEELRDCHAATAFVGWYNAHPDFRDFPFDLQTGRAVVVGVGNVALDISRVLLRSPAELAKTDIAGHALDVLEHSKIREVVLLARRGPAEAAFEQKELADIAALEGVSVHIDPEVLERDAARVGELDAKARRNVEYMLELTRAQKQKTERALTIRFLTSPLEVLEGEPDRVRGVLVEKNELVEGERGPTARGTGETFEIDAGIVFRSVGYYGLPLPDVPYDQKRGIIPNEEGRVLDAPGGSILPGVYAVGWIRRGPVGVIGTNKADAQAVAELMAEDLPKLSGRSDAAVTHAAVDALLARRGVRVASYADWGVIDQLEVSQGKERGKIREKLTTVEQMLDSLPPRRR